MTYDIVKCILSKAGIMTLDCSMAFEMVDHSKLQKDDEWARQHQNKGFLLLSPEVQY